MKINASNPCPICQKTHGCKYSPKNDSIVWCLRGSSSTSVFGWEWKHDLSSNMGAAFKQVDENKVSFVKREKATPYLKSTLKEFIPRTDEDLDKAYRILVSERILEARDRRLLQNRGVDPDWMESQGVCTVKPSSKTEAKNVPGIKSNRVCMNAGFFIPAVTPWGKIVGGQISTVSGNPGKYVWVKGLSEARSGKLPIFSAYDIYSNSVASTNTATLLLTVELKTSKYVVGASLSNEYGDVLETATKAYNTTNSSDVPYLNALILGYQLSLKYGVKSLKIKGIPYPIKHSLVEGFTDLKEQALANIVIYLQNKQIDYKFTDYGIFTPITPTAETEKAGEKYFDTKTVWLVDGAAKAFYTAYKHKVLCFGHPMANFVSGGVRFEFNKYLQAYGVENVIHAPDAGDVLNEANIPKVNNSLHKEVKKLGYDISVAWWGQFSKEHHKDIDEIDSLRSVQYLTPLEFFGLHSQKIQATINPLSLQTTEVQELADPTPYPRFCAERKATGFKEGNRLQALRWAIQQSKFVHDKSEAGSGKSRDFSRLIPDNLGVRQIIWVTNDPMSSDYDVPSYRGKDYARYRRASDGRILAAYSERDIPDKSKIVAEGNCKRTEYIQHLVERNVVPTYKNTCNVCEFAKECSKTEGMYHYDRAKTLTQKIFRCSPAALNPDMVKDIYGAEWSKSEESTPGTAIILDDIVLGQFYQNILITKEEIEAHLKQFINFFNYMPKFANALRSLIEVLGNNQYLKMTQILKAVGDVKDDQEARALSDLIEDEFQYLNNAEDELSSVKKRWISEVYDVLTNPHKHKETHVMVNNHQLMVVSLNKALYDTIQSGGVKTVIIGDATGNTEFYEMLFGVEEVTVIKQDLPKEQATLNIYQFTDLGDCGSRKSPRQLEKIKKMKEKLYEIYNNQLAVIEAKKDIEANSALSESVDTLNWLGTSRGSNACVNKLALLAVGTPRTNLSALEAQYSMLTGKLLEPSDPVRVPYPINSDSGYYARVVVESKDPGFSEFVYRSTHAEITQGFARLRAIRRPNETLNIFFLSTFPIQHKVTLTTTAQYTDEEDVVLKLTGERIESTVQTLVMDGVELTQNAIAEHMGVTRRVVNYYFEKAGRDWVNFKHNAVKTYSVIRTEKTAETFTQSVIREMHDPYLLYKQDQRSAACKTRITDCVYVPAYLDQEKIKVGSSYEITYQNAALTVVVLEVETNSAVVRVMVSDGLDVSRSNYLITLPFARLITPSP